jgi:hypothetical protein
VNGSPVKPDGHTQLGMCTTTWHSALAPQDPGQGSWHFCLMHARWLAHSLLIIHSGRQPGGAPTYPARQVHDGLPSAETRHCELGPQGDGWHESWGAGGGIGVGAAK